MDTESKREMEQARRLEARRTPGVLGRGPDSDSPDATSKIDYGHREDAFRRSETDGYWKRSEFLACNRGDKMETLDLSKLMGGPTWTRAHKEWNDQHPTCAD